MFRNLKQISPGAAIILMLVLINAIILKYSLTGEFNIYWLLFITVPLLIAAIMLMKYELFFTPQISTTSIDKNAGSVLVYRSDAEKQNDAFDLYGHRGWSGDQWQSYPIRSQRFTGDDLRVTVGNDQCQQPYSASILNIGAKHRGIYSEAIFEALNMGAREGNFAQHTGDFRIESRHLKGGDLIWQVSADNAECCDENDHFDFRKFRAIAGKPEVKMIELKLSACKNSEGSAFRTAEGALLFLQSIREGSSGKPVGIRTSVECKKDFFEICYSIHRTGIVPDFITIEGGYDFRQTPIKFLKHHSMPLYEAIAFVSKTIEHYRLKHRIRIFVDGEFRNGFEVIKVLSLGADACYGSGTMMLAADDIQMLRYHLPVIADSKSCVANFHGEVIKETKSLMDAFGFEKLDEISVSAFLGKLNQPRAFSSKLVNVTGQTKNRFYNLEIN
ncbi:glutamate synthase-related protein [Pollutibacter soli]|uniref:glutamate synthase-related protein n=1 Tax=Pollutibacter soli TaxID=3034157 RepID=UPI003013FB42